MKNALGAAALWLLTSVFAVAQNLDIPMDTVFQQCPPDSSFLYAESNVMSTSSYTYQQIPFNTESVGGTTVTLGDDQISGPYNIGFTFNYFCVGYTQFYICSNGWIGFSSGQTSTWVITTIPSTGSGTPKNNIMAPWRDWHPGTGGNGPYIRYQTQGSAPCRKLVVTWSAVPMYSCTSTTGTFQIVLHETTNIIHMNQTNVPVCTNWGNGDGTQGLHNANGTTAVAVTGRNDSQFTCTNQTWEFLPTSPIVWSSNGNIIDTGNCITVAPVTSTWYYASGVDCSGNNYTDSVLVAVSCIDLIVDSTDVVCTGDSSGMAVAVDTSTSTTGPYTFYWYNSVGSLVSTSFSNDSIDTLFNVPAGYYTVLAYDGQNQVASGSTTINEPPIKDALTASIDLLCNGDGTGVAIAADTNDYTGIIWNGLYSFIWEDGSGTGVSSIFNTTNSTDTVTELAAGTYYVTIDGCFISEGVITVDEPPVLTTTILNATQTSCPGMFCDANATANPTGGVSPYAYNWTSNEGTLTASSLCPGANSLTVTDINGCDTVFNFTIGSPDSIVTSTFGDTQICITNPASLAASSLGGTPPYAYIWTIDSMAGAVQFASNTGLVYPHVTKRYFVTSTDANGCEGDTGSVLIKVRPPLGVKIDPVDTICPYDTVPVFAAGIGGDSIYTYTWENGAFGYTTLISPDLPGYYNVTVSDQCGTPSYMDSVWVQVGGYSPIEADIRVEDDSICIGESVYLIASGRGGFKGPDEYRFKWSQPSWDGNPVQFMLPLKTNTYYVTITDLCLSPLAIDTVTISVGQPDMPLVSVTPSVACSNADVQFTIDTLKEHYDYTWTLGDGEKVFNVQNRTFSHSYNVAGCYDVTLGVVTDFGCPSSKSFPCLVKILESPTAQFTHNPVQSTTIEPIVHFMDESVSAENIEWFINEVTYGEDSRLVYEFGDTGTYAVTLIATSEEGCTDTVTKLMHHDLQTVIHVPTSFTPNGDGLNDVFYVKGEGLDKATFSLEIFDRWGSSVFYTGNPAYGWDGRSSKDGQMAPLGTYAYVLRYADEFGELKMLTGQIHITKSGSSSDLK